MPLQTNARCLKKDFPKHNAELEKTTIMLGPLNVPELRKLLWQMLWHVPHVWHSSLAGRSGCSITKPLPWHLTGSGERGHHEIQL
jgi:hypothetical protein